MIVLSLDHEQFQYVKYHQMGQIFLLKDLHLSNQREREEKREREREKEREKIQLKNKESHNIINLKRKI